MSQIKITLKKSQIGCIKNQKEALRVLRLRRIGQSSTFKDAPSVRGQIRVVRHMVSVEKSKGDKS